MTATQTAKPKRAEARLAQLDALQIAEKLEAAFGAPFKHDRTARVNGFARTYDHHEFSSDEAQVFGVSIWALVEDRFDEAREIARAAAPDLERAA